jgi:hypothetical protein
MNSFPPDVWDIHKPHKTSCTTWFNSVKRPRYTRAYTTPLTPPYTSVLNDGRSIICCCVCLFTDCCGGLDQLVIG